MFLSTLKFYTVIHLNQDKLIYLYSESKLLEIKQFKA